VIAPEWDDPAGVPISAFLFGGRRATTVPLVYEAFSWEHGVFLASTIASEKTAAASDAKGDIRRDPFAMLPFCGYNMADYFAHWLAMTDRVEATKLPKIFGVNWFRKDADGAFLWPGYGENSRVLEWIFGRCIGSAHATETPIGLVPGINDLDRVGLPASDAAVEAALAVRTKEWQAEAASIARSYEAYGDRLPDPLRSQLAALQDRLGL
jgi:phosphoenolpyruvate carboxykinase (GTP)